MCDSEVGAVRCVKCGVTHYPAEEACRECWQVGRARAEADAARYRWLRENLCRIEVTPSYDGCEKGIVGVAKLAVMPRLSATDPDSVDAAIDRAMEG